MKSGHWKVQTFRITLKRLRKKKGVGPERGFDNACMQEDEKVKNEILRLMIIIIISNRPFENARMA